MRLKPLANKQVMVT